MKTKRLCIFGASGHGKVAAEIAELSNRYRQIAFVDRLFPELRQLEHWPVLVDGENLTQLGEEFDEFFVAIGNNTIRSKIQAQLQERNFIISTLVHPSAAISKYAKLGTGTLVCANACVNPAAIVGQGCIINTASSIDHDCKLDDFVHIAPGVRIAGNVSVGRSSFVGIGSAIIQAVQIGSDCIVGAGSTVISNIANNSVAFGTPARTIKQNDN